MLVQRYNIITTKTQIYTVWETTKLFDYAHSTITSVVCEHTAQKGFWWGELSARRLPDELDALKPMSEERSVAVRSWRENVYQEAYEQIYKAFPHLRAIKHRKDMGKIETIGETYATRSEAKFV